MSPLLIATIIMAAAATALGTLAARLLHAAKYCCPHVEGDGGAGFEEWCETAMELTRPFTAEEVTDLRLRFHADQQAATQ